MYLSVVHDCRWRGDYSDKKQNWFPSNYVEEIENQDDTSESAPLGSLQKGSIDVRKCILGKKDFRDINRLYLESLLIG